MGGMTIRTKTLPRKPYIIYEFPNIEDYIYVFKQYYKGITEIDKEKLKILFANEKEYEQIEKNLIKKNFEKINISVYKKIFNIIHKDDFHILFKFSEINREHYYIFEKKQYSLIFPFDMGDENFFRYKRNLNDYTVEGEAYHYDNPNEMKKDIEKLKNEDFNFERFYSTNDFDKMEKDDFDKKSKEIIKNYILDSKNNENKLRNLFCVDKIKNFELEVNLFFNINEIKNNYNNIIKEIEEEKLLQIKREKDLNKYNQEISM